MFHGGASMAALASILELRTCKAPPVFSPIMPASKLSIELTSSRRPSASSSVGGDSTKANTNSDGGEDMKVGFEEDQPTMSGLGNEKDTEIQSTSNNESSTTVDFFKNAAKPMGGVFPSSLLSNLNTIVPATAHDPALLAAIHYVETMRISPPELPRPSKPPLSVGAMLSPVLMLPSRDIEGLLSPIFTLPPSLETGILPPHLQLPTCHADSLPPVLTLPPDDSESVILVTDESDSPTMASSIMAAINSGSPVVPGQSMTDLKDIYMECGESPRPAVNNSFSVEGINTSLFGKLEEDESSGQIESDSDSSTDLDYENYDNEDSFVMQSVTASRASNPGPTPPVVSTPAHLIDIYAPRQLRTAPPQTYSAVFPPAPPSTNPQKRGRGRPKLNRYLLPPNHPKYLPPPPRHLIPQIYNQDSTPSAAPHAQQYSSSSPSLPAIRVKLRIPPRVASSLQSTTFSSASSTPSQPLSPPHSINHPEDLPPIDESVLQDLGPAAAAAMRRRLRDNTSSASQSSIHELYQTSQKVILPPNGRGPALIIGPDGIPVKRGRGRPRKKLRPDEIIRSDCYFNAAEAAAAYPYLIQQGVYGEYTVGSSSGEVRRRGPARTRQKRGGGVAATRVEDEPQYLELEEVDEDETSGGGVSTERFEFSNSHDGAAGWGEGADDGEVSDEDDDQDFRCDILGEEPVEDGFHSDFPVDQDPVSSSVADTVVGGDSGAFDENVEAHGDVFVDVMQSVEEDLPDKEKEPAEVPSFSLVTDEKEGNVSAEVVEFMTAEPLVSSPAPPKPVVDDVDVVAEVKDVEMAVDMSTPVGDVKMDAEPSTKASVVEVSEAATVAETPTAMSKSAPKRSRKKAASKVVSTLAEVIESDTTPSASAAPAAESSANVSAEKENKKKRASPKSVPKKRKSTAATPAPVPGHESDNEDKSKDALMSDATSAVESAKVEGSEVPTSTSKPKLLKATTESDTKSEDIKLFEPVFIIVDEENKALHSQLHAKLHIQLQKVADEERRKKESPTVLASSSSATSTTTSATINYATFGDDVVLKEANTIGQPSTNVLSAICAIAGNNIKRRALPTLLANTSLPTSSSSAKLSSPTADASLFDGDASKPDSLAHSDKPSASTSDPTASSSKESRTNTPSYRRRLRLGLLSVIPEGTTEKRFVCPACGKDYKNANGVKYHINKSHPDGNGIPPLLYIGGPGGDGDDDGGVDGDDSTSQNHSADVSMTLTAEDDDERPIVCFLGSCDKNFKSLNGLRYHVRTVHAKLVAEAETRNILEGYEVPEDELVLPSSNSSASGSRSRSTKPTRSAVSRKSYLPSTKSQLKRKSPSPETDDEDDQEDDDDKKSTTSRRSVGSKMMDVDGPTDSDIEEDKPKNNKRHRSGVSKEGEEDVLDQAVNVDGASDDEELPMSRRRSARAK
ncbi:UNVERIFIED_CONTAM: hypothetical protein HDU68_012124 [Siphonaria sp. JEL0065]|nr:hypothetical protein HDU68_012124 [Siphonaria sp. JEL0065]